MAGQFTLTLTQDQFSAAIAKAKAAGIELPPEGGALPPTAGIQAHYTVDRSPMGIAVTIIIDKKPFYVPESAIESHVRQLLGC